MRSENEEYDRRELHEHADLKRLFRQCTPSFARISADDLLIEASSETRTISPILVAEPEPLTLKRSRSRQALVLATSAVLVLTMLLISSTDAWAQLALNLSSPNNAPQPISTLAAPIAPDPPSPSAGVRFILLVHVGLLGFGLLGLFVSWITALVYWLRSLWGESPRSPRGAGAFKYILTGSLVCYAIGLACGCIWSQLVWGRPWSWSPPETFGLLTIGIGVLWLQDSRAPTEAGETRLRRATQSACTATIAFGLTLLMWTLGGIYAAKAHSYGFPSRLPTWIAAALFLCLLVVWSTSIYRQRVMRRQLRSDGVR